MTSEADPNSRANRSEALTAVALDLFAERGFAGVTMKDIARKAGVNPALIYYYFEDKADLFRATIVYAVSIAHERYMHLRAGHGDPMERINAWFESNVLHADRIRKLVKIMLDYTSSRAHIRGVDVAIKEFYKLERLILAESIRRGTHDGIFRARDADQLANLISIHLDGVMVASAIRGHFDMNGALADLRALLGQHLLPEEPKTDTGWRRSNRSGSPTV